MENKTLWAFGCSFTYGFGCIKDDEGNEYYENYYDKSKQHDIWPNHLGKFLNYSVKNFGVNGYSNWDIIDTIIKQQPNIKENDIVVIGKTRYDRNRYPDGNGDWIHPGDKIYNIKNFDSWGTFIEQQKKTNKPLTLDKIKTIIDFQLQFANHSLYRKRQDLYYDYLIDTIYKLNKVKKVEVFNISNLYRFETIHTHSNKTIFDMHLSFNGHLNFAKKLYKKITNTSINTI